MDEKWLATLSAGQHGVVALRQLTARGLDRRTAAYHRSTGRWRLVHPGVYATGHARLTRQGHWMAAVLASGPGAVVSHRDAAALHGIRPSNARRIEVSTPHRSRRGVRGIHLHRPRRLPGDEVTEEDGIPVTTVARTLVDLAAVLSPTHLRRAVHEAEVARILDVTLTRSVIAESNGRRGLRLLERILDGPPDTPTRNVFERRFLELVTAAGLPPPRTNAHVDLGERLVEVDALWAESRLAVELDGRTVHDTTRAFEQDRARDVRLQLLGFRVARVTWARLAEAPEEVMDEIGALLTDTRPAAPAPA